MDEDLESVDIVPGNILASPVASEVSVEVKGLVAAEADSFEAEVDGTTEELSSSEETATIGEDGLKKVVNETEVIGTKSSGGEWKEIDLDNSETKEEDEIDTGRIPVVLQIVSRKECEDHSYKEASEDSKTSAKVSGERLAPSTVAGSVRAREDESRETLVVAEAVESEANAGELETSKAKKHSRAEEEDIASSTKTSSVVSSGNDASDERIPVVPQIELKNEEEIVAVDKVVHSSGPLNSSHVVSHSIPTCKTLPTIETVRQAVFVSQVSVQNNKGSESLSTKKADDDVLGQLGSSVGPDSPRRGSLDPSEARLSLGTTNSTTKASSSTTSSGEDFSSSEKESLEASLVWTFPDPRRQWLSPWYG